MRKPENCDSERMSYPDKLKYIVENIRIEIEHTRSWPNKILAFYVAINAGLISLSDKLNNIAHILLYTAIGINLILAIIISCILGKNHLNYLKNRNLQIIIQRNNNLQCIF